jgi:hypothetical protein
MVFGELKRLFYEIIFRRALNGELYLDMTDFFAVYREARERAITERIYRAAF